MARGYGYTPAAASAGNVTLNANSGNAAEITLEDNVIAVNVWASRAARLGIAAAGTPTGAGKTAVTTGAAYLNLPADLPFPVACAGASKRSESLYIISDDATPGTFSYQKVYRDE